MRMIVTGREGQVARSLLERTLDRGIEHHAFGIPTKITSQTIDERHRSGDAPQRSRNP